jgi:flagellar biosynthesis/type III secretory pathway protein FliH
MGRLIKGFGHVVPKVVLDAQGEAAALRARAAADAAAVRAEATAAREAVRREGFETGRAEGLAEAAVALAAARAEAARLVEDAEPVAIALGAKMAERIVGHAVAVAPDTMADIAAQAIAACRPGGSAIRVWVHPDDLAAVEARRERLTERAPGVTIELVADEAVGRHGCVIETAQGRLDARLETQLDALERALRGVTARGE